MGTKVINSSQFSKWHKLDNSAKIFPAASSLTTANVFRLACVLHEAVNPALLQQALMETIGSFPAFNVRMRAGLFWYYFERNPHAPRVSHEELYPCAPMNRRENDGFLFRVLYHESRISLETYHALTDGTGGLEFLRAIVRAYLALAHAEEGIASGPAAEASAPNATEICDGYHEIYRESRKLSPMTGRAFRIRGMRLPFTAIKVVHGEVKTSALLAEARKRGVTITALLAAALVYAIHLAEHRDSPLRQPVVVTLPVNLRHVFGRKSALNFFECVSVGVQFDREGQTFDEVLAIVSDNLRTQLEKENLIAMNAYKVGLSRMILIRIIPLFLKNIVLGAAYHRGELASTTALSNLGKVDMDENAKKHIDRYEFTLSPTESNSLKCAVCSFEEKLVVTFSSSLEQNNVQTSFFRHLAGLGLDIAVEANYLYVPKPDRMGKKYAREEKEQ